jgi:hypothetical protein
MSSPGINTSFSRRVPHGKHVDVVKINTWVRNHKQKKGGGGWTGVGWFIKEEIVVT